MNYNNVLTKACKFGHIEVVREALKLGASPNSQYALKYASYEGHTEIVNLLKNYVKEK